MINFGKLFFLPDTESFPFWETFKEKTFVFYSKREEQKASLLYKVGRGQKNIYPLMKIGGEVCFL